METTQTTRSLTPAEEASPHEQEVEDFVNEVRAQQPAVDAMLEEIASGKAGAHDDYTDWVYDGTIPERHKHLIRD